MARSRVVTRGGEDDQPGKEDLKIPKNDPARVNVVMTRQGKKGWGKMEKNWNRYRDRTLLKKTITGAQGFGPKHYWGGGTVTANLIKKKYCQMSGSRGREGKLTLQEIYAETCAKCPTPSLA